MKGRRFVDTNILLYSISRDPGEAAKCDRAVALLDADDLALSAQVLQEFYIQATRANRADALPHDIAAGLIHAWTRFPVQEVSLGIATAALEIRAARGFSYWDSAIIAAAQALGCHELLSEDMSHGQQIDDVTIVNPFR
ncbi:MAG: PIN domain-containing protein [Reyranella sp.]|uniref:PIN domain-containing protein n=1 Tax=Reyranella sp. TaxID=1929291 RepID=UPI00120C0199|nr:PIN domain-containing protein [Reyranella sp.]TAJ35601.1 MAG: PIN domain-containing protein [Reyranella sp.]